MANNDEDETDGLQSAIGIGPGRGSELNRKSPDSGEIDQAKELTASVKDDGEKVTTAGGREGNFAESKRGDEGPWSPGAAHPPDQ